MASGFRRLGPARVKRQKRILLFGSSTIVISLSIICLLLLTGRADLSATKNITLETPLNEQVAIGTVVLLTPMAEVSQGTKLSQVPLREIYWPRDRVPEGALRKDTNLKHYFAKGNLPAGQPIIRSSLTNAPRASGVAGRLPKGYRAITIEVDATSGVDGWAGPQAHVDLYLTYLGKVSGQMKTQVVVSDAIVLSYDRSTDEKGNAASSRGSIGGSNQNRQNSTVTLQVTIQDSLKVHTARAMGRISLALRGHNEDAKYTGYPEFSQSQFERGGSSKKNLHAKRDGFAHWNSNGQEKSFVFDESTGRWVEETMY